MQLLREGSLCEGHLPGGEGREGAQGEGSCPVPAAPSDQEALTVFVRMYQRAYLPLLGTVGVCAYGSAGEVRP